LIYLFLQIKKEEQKTEALLDPLKLRRKDVSIMGAKIKALLEPQNHLKM
tara:strand:- start:72 stop:218 length:147 start_codon:yes stop_codon:yes gene_type:complete